MICMAPSLQFEREPSAHSFDKQVHSFTVAWSLFRNWGITHSYTYKIGELLESMCTENDDRRKILKS